MNSKEKDNSRKSDVENGEDNGWLYTDKVKDHFFNPRNIFKTDQEAEKYETEADGIGQVGSPACLPPNSLINSENGLVSIDKITKKERVLSHTGEFKQITEIKKKKFDDCLILLKTKLGLVNLTSDHLVYSIRRPKESKYNYMRNRRDLVPEWNYARDLKKNDFIIYPRSNSIYDLSNLNNSIIKKKYDFKSKDLPNDINVTSELLRLFGYYIAEGCTRKDVKRSNEVVFTFNIKEKNYINDVKHLLNKYFKLDCKINEYKSSNKCDVVVYSVHLSNLFKKHFGCGAINKKISTFLMYLPIEKQKGLLCGLWRGDGYINNK